MFNHLILSILFLTLIGCSKSGDSGKVVEIPIIQEASISAVVGQAEPIVLDLGNIAYGKSADGMISIKQSLVASLIPSGLVDGKLVVSGSEELSILSQSGCTSIKKSTGTCSIKVRANTQGLSEGTAISGYIFFHLDSETEEETFIQISATVGNAPVVEPSALVSSSSTASFGSLSASDSAKDLILTYKALSLISSSDSHSVVVPAPFVIQSASADRCSNKTISKGASCTVKIRLDPKQVSTNGLVSGNITFAGLSIPVSATISGNPEVGQPSVAQFAWIYNGAEISALDLGTLLSSNVPVKFNLFLKNKSSSPEEVNVSFSGSGFTIINRCIDKMLAPQAQCSLEVRPEQSEGSKSVAISVEDQPALSLPLAMNVINQVTTYQTVETTPACSSLNLQICGGTQSISKSYLCEQYVNGIKNDSYSGNDCSPLADMSPLSCQSPAGTREVVVGADTKSESCALGASVWVQTDIVCGNPIQHKDGLSCVNSSLVSSDPVFPENTLLAGEGQATVSATDYVCTNTNTSLVVDKSNCVAPTETQLSPAGLRIEEILGGSLNYNCAVGDSFANVYPIVICDSGYTPDQINLLCEEDIIVPMNYPLGLVSGFNDTVQSISVQEDGKILVGGAFSTYNGVSSNYIIRLNTDGSIDSSFNVGTGFNAIVHSIAVQADGKILVGGGFTAYKGVSSNRIIRLNTDGTIDSSFNVGTGFNNTVNSIVVQEDGKILLGGDFTTYNGVSSKYIIRLNTDGSRDSSFNVGTGFSSTVLSIEVQEDGKILVGGAFTTYNGVSSTRIIRLNTDGSIDSSFNVGTGFNSSVFSIVEQGDGKILVSGNFTTYNGVSSNRIVRLDTDGTIDSSFNVGSGFNDIVYSIVVQEDGKILLGGYFSTYNGVSSSKIIRLNTDGSRDSSFNVGTGFDTLVSSIVVQEDGKILLGGDFTTYNGVSSTRIIRLNQEGDYDLSFRKPDTSGFNNTVNSIVVQEDGKILVGGNFITYNGVSSTRIIRLNTDGSIDSSFNVGTGFNLTVYSIAVQEDGKILVGGDFAIYNGVSSNRIIRLNTDGSIDSSFNVGTGFNAIVHSIAVQADGRFLVGGSFTTYNGVSSNYIIRLNTDGSIDSSFNVGTGFNSTVRSIVVQEDGKILVGGNFITYNGVSRNRIIRLNTDGSIDSSFNVGTGFNLTVYSIAVQADGKILVGGGFTTYNSVSSNRIIRLNTDGSIDSSFNVGTGFNSFVYSIAVQEDGKILLGGNFATYNGVSRNRIIRLNTDGSIDSSFNVGTGVGTGFNSVVLSIVVQEDGKILVGGGFMEYNYYPFYRIIRINSDASIENLLE